MGTFGDIRCEKQTGKGRKHNQKKVYLPFDLAFGLSLNLWGEAGWLVTARFFLLVLGDFDLEDWGGEERWELLEEREEVEE